MNGRLNVRTVFSYIGIGRWNACCCDDSCVAT